MNANQTKELVQLMQTVKGQNVRVVWRRDCETFKGTSQRVEKQVTAICRSGINYDKMAAVIAKRESGELPRENAGLPWGKWVESAFPFLIEHKGKEYVRLNPASGEVFGGKTIQTEFFLDGQPVAFESVRHLLKASEMPKDETPDCFTVKAENVLAFSSLIA